PIFACLMLQRHPCSPLFPYTTLFRSPMRSVTSAEAHAEVFQLGVVEDPVLRALAAGARLLDASEGRDLGGDDSGIEADDAVLERSEEHTSELQSLAYLVCRLLLEKKK